MWANVCFIMSVDDLQKPSKITPITGRFVKMTKLFKGEAYLGNKIAEWRIIRHPHLLSPAPRHIRSNSGLSRNLVDILNKCLQLELRVVGEFVEMLKRTEQASRLSPPKN